MEGNNHLYILQVPMDMKLPENEMAEFLYSNFYQPTSRQILNYWIDDFQKYFDHEKDFFDEIISHLHYNEAVLNNLIHSITLYISRQNNIINENDFAYIYFIQKPILFFQIKELIINIIKEHNY